MCEAGDFYDTKSMLCQKCPVNTYSSFPGRSDCTKCSDGKQTLRTGSTSEIDCKCKKTLIPQSIWEHMITDKPY